MLRGFIKNGREEERLEPAARFRAYGLPPPPEKKWRNISIVFMVATVLCLILFLASFTSLLLTFA